jgi:hypothetical protein
MSEQKLLGCGDVRIGDCPSDLNSNAAQQPLSTVVDGGEQKSQSREIECVTSTVEVMRDCSLLSSSPASSLGTTDDGGACATQKSVCDREVLKVESSAAIVASSAIDPNADTKDKLIESQQQVIDNQKLIITALNDTLDTKSKIFAALEETIVQLKAQVAALNGLRDTNAKTIGTLEETIDLLKARVSVLESSRTTADRGNRIGG